MDDKILITQGKVGGIIYSIIAIVLSLSSMLLLVLDLRGLDGPLVYMGDVIYYILKVIFFIGFVFFGYGFYYLLKRTMVGVTLLCVDEKGITDNSSAISFGFMPWEDIEDVILTYFMGQAYIEVKLRNPEYYIEKLPAWKKAMVNANLKMGMQAVNISLNVTKYNPKLICAYIQDIMQQVKGK